MRGCVFVEHEPVNDPFATVLVNHMDRPRLSRMHPHSAVLVTRQFALNLQSVIDVLDGTMCVGIHEIRNTHTLNAMATCPSCFNSLV